jgi:actin-related protein
MAEERATVVVAPGRHRLSAGFAGDDSPRAVFAPVIGRPRKQNALMYTAYQDPPVGDEAFAKRGVLELHCPFNPETGFVATEGRDSEDYERLLHHTFYTELRVAPEEHSVLIAEPCMNPAATRAWQFQTLFETFCIPGVFLEMAPKLALFASGRTSGLVVDLGHGSVEAAAFEERPRDASTGPKAARAPLRWTRTRSCVRHRLVRLSVAVP